jgi:F-type H+-transporting ATPase subunit a
MSGPLLVLAGGLVGEETPFPPSVEDIFPPGLAGAGPWLTKFTMYLWIGVAITLIFFLVAYRRPKLVPTRGQWLAESVYSFIRDGVAREVVGHEGLRFAPYLAALFCFILVTNIFGIIPFIQVSPNAHVAFPIVLAVLSYLLFLHLGVRKHGLLRYLRINLIPDAPWQLWWLLIPIELMSTFVLRPITLSLRLFANMFAGHMLLLVFTLGGFALLNAENLFIKGVSVLSWAMAIVLTFFELLVAVLQAYVFVILTASYVEGALAEGH